MKNVNEVVVNAEVINGDAQPLFIYEDGEEPGVTEAAS